MAIHRDLTPDFRESVARTALKALHAASAQETAGNGTVSVRNADGTTTVIGAGAGVDETGAPKGMDSFRGDTTPPGRPLGVAFSSVACDATAYWDGRLDGGVPADFDRVEFYAKRGEAKSFMGCLAEAGSLSMQFKAGDTLDCWAVAFDMQGNASGESAHAALNVVDVPSQAKAAADEAKKMVEAANADIAGQAEEVRQVSAKADAAKAAAAEAQSKAEAAASDLHATKAVVERHTGELGELSTKVGNAATKADSALTASTEAKQNATEATTKAETAYKDSQTALTASTTATQTAAKAQTTAESAAETASDSLKQSSQATQTANEVSAKLRTEYQTKADADKVYATQASLKATSESISSEVSKTYATKATVDALRNIADNAIESWRGSGVPTTENKPASDWTTPELKKQHNGDLYYDKATGKAYRWGSDDGVAYTWELNQDSDVAKALQDASKAQTAANEAGTAASEAQAKADDASGKADAAKSVADTAKGAADSAASAASKAQGDVDKLKVDIPATYVTKSAFEQTAEGITASVTKAQHTADSAATASTKAQQTADGISAELSKSYQTKAQADATYATQASLKATSESLTASVTKAQGTADGAVTSASKAQQTADAVSLNLSKNYTSTADADKKFATKAEVTATSESITSSVSKTYATKEALSATDSNVTKAKQAADSASAAASSATTTANAAKTTADVASTNASAAKSTADKANATADSAKTNADKAQRDVNALKNRVTSAETSIKQNSDAIALRATKTEVTSAIDGISVGGRNLLTNTKTLANTSFNTLSSDMRISSTNLFNGNYTATCKRAWSHYGVLLGRLKDIYDIKVGDQITYSIWFKFTTDNLKDTDDRKLRLAWYGAKGDIDYGYNVGACDVDTDADVWKRYSHTFNVTESILANGVYVRIECGYYTESDYTSPRLTQWWSSPKLEFGNKATDWSPAPEDLQNDATTKANNALASAKTYADAQIKVSADSIKSEVSSVKTTADSALSKATSVEQTTNGLTTTIASVKSTADTAKTDAASAKSTAGTAASNALNALTKANDATTDAATAKSDASTAKSTASTASTNASSALTKSTTLETLIRQSGNGVEIAKKVNGSYTSTKTLMDDTGFSVLDKAGNILSKFGAEKIELGKNSASSIIEMCAGRGTISSNGPGLVFASKVNNNKQGYMSAYPGSASIVAVSGNYLSGVTAIANEKQCGLSIFGNTFEVQPQDGADSVWIDMRKFANMLVDSGWRTVWSDTNNTVKIRRVGYCVTLFIYADAGSFGTDWEKWTKVPDEFKPSFDVYAAVAAGANTGNNNVMLANVSTDGYVYVKTMGGTCTGVRGQVTWFLDVG